MREHPTSLRLSAEVGALLERLAELRGLTKTDIVVTGILAQAEVFGLIPSVRDALADLMQQPRTTSQARPRQRLSATRPRARRTPK